jgi:hypothetical protein
VTDPRPEGSGFDRRQGVNIQPTPTKGIQADAGINGLVIVLRPRCCEGQPSRCETDVGCSFSKGREDVGKPLEGPKWDGVELLFPAIFVEPVVLSPHGAHCRYRRQIVPPAFGPARGPAFGVGGLLLGVRIRRRVSGTGRLLPCGGPVGGDSNLLSEPCRSFCSTNESQGELSTRDAPVDGHQVPAHPVEMSALNERTAAATTKALLASDPARLRHSSAVAVRARQLATGFAADDLSALVTAAWLHDVGHAPRVQHTGMHALDGARHLAGKFPRRIVSLVARHSGARYEAALRGLTSELAAFEEESSLVPQ